MSNVGKLKKSMGVYRSIDIKSTGGKVKSTSSPSVVSGFDTGRSKEELRVSIDPAVKMADKFFK